MLDKCSKIPERKQIPGYAGATYNSVGFQVIGDDIICFATHIKQITLITPTLVLTFSVLVQQHISNLCKSD